MKLEIRKENEKEFDLLRNFITKAFETAKVSDGNEAKFVDSLRKDPEKYIPELAFVVLNSNEIIGHIMLTRIQILDENRQNPMMRNALLLAPLSIKKEFRHQGIGKKLVEHAIDCAKLMNFNVIFVVGDPNYYARFGFVPSINFNIKADENIEPKYVMARELVLNSLKNIKGTIVF